MNQLHAGARSHILSLFFFFVAILPTFAQGPQPVYFEQVVAKRLSAELGDSWTYEKFCPVATDGLAMKVLQSYGSMFVANDLVRLPPSCVLRGESDVLKYQRSLPRKILEINRARIDLQLAASASLEIALADATLRGLNITPFDGAIAGGRSYGDTLMLWNSRVFPALEFWIQRGRLPAESREEFGRLDLHKKIEKIFEWESQGIFFSKNRTRSILTSTAPPGTSQHLALLAFDIVEFWNPEIRAIMNRNGWYQTVIDDPGHFTYLGFPETELPGRGLTAVMHGGHLYWIPNFAPRTAPTN